MTIRRAIGTGNLVTRTRRSTIGAGNPVTRTMRVLKIGGWDACGTAGRVQMVEGSHRIQLWGKGLLFGEPEAQSD